MKVALLLLALMASVASASAGEIQALLFPAEYGGAARDLRLLVWGYSGYSFVVTSAWIFNSGSRARTALLLVLVTLGVVVGVCLWLVPTHTDLGAAYAVCLAGGLGVVASLVMLRMGLGVRMPCCTSPSWAWLSWRWRRWGGCGGLRAKSRRSASSSSSPWFSYRSSCSLAR